jgi:peptidoglycan/xylan/chitin deacetylase (PgdA/CDA1 family)
MMNHAAVKLLVPTERLAEVRWVADFILSEYLGLNYQLQPEPGAQCFRLEAAGRSLCLPNVFFARAAADWLGTTTLPTEPIKIWTINEVPLTAAGLFRLPVLYGAGGFEMTSSQTAHLKLDVFGSCFFILSRYEELVAPKRDRYGRFPSVGSISRRQRFLQEPVVDHYIEVFWAAMQAVWPEMTRRQRQGTVSVSCDVDEPYERWITDRRWLAVGITGALAARRSFPAARNRIENYHRSRKGDYSRDKNWTFDWYMEVCEKLGRSATFFFFGRKTGTRFDAVYELRERRISELMRIISQRGHKIGLHGSYFSYKDANLLQQERENLEVVCGDLGIPTPITAARQHYLRFEVEATPLCLEAAGIKSDSSGGYADFAGFRYGTARSFQMWSFSQQRPLAVRQHPLVVMECSIIDLMGLGYSEDAYNTAETLKKKSLRFGGDFTLLWHNSHLTSDEDKAMFVQLLR